MVEHCATHWLGAIEHDRQKSSSTPIHPDERKLFSISFSHKFNARETYSNDVYNDMEIIRTLAALEQWPRSQPRSFGLYGVLKGLIWIA